MSTEPHPSAAPESDSTHKQATPSLTQRLSQKIKAMFRSQQYPEDLEDINELLNYAHDHGIIGNDVHEMILGSISFAEKMASDIMVSRSKMDCIDINDPIDEILPFIIETAHSRFPVYENERDNIIGLLLAKDLLRYALSSEHPIRELIRPAYFVPETKPLNQLMQEFKKTHNHIAIVIDEYGSVTGLVTMENLLEQIVGDIEDEYDDDATQTIFPESDNRWRVMGISSIKHINDTINSTISEDEYDTDTIGGWLAAELDRIPVRGDTYVLNDVHHQCSLEFKVLRADEKRALWIHIHRRPLRS